MAKDLLLEIGTEEIPAHFMPGILAQVAEKAKKSLDELRISYDDLKTYGTPRRIALVVTGVAESQTSETVEYKGPSVAIAFDADHKPTKAAIGFARGKNTPVEDLVEKDGYIYAVTQAASSQTAELLPDLLKGLIESLTFPKNMRWGDLDVRFVRPVRWIVALFGNEVIDFEFANVKTGKVSRGHRFLSQGDFTIENASDYLKACEGAFVMVDQNQRRDIIQAQIEALAAKHSGTAEITDDLLEEVTYLVEYPTALCGNFEEKYLSLPKEAVITPMRDHQRYFPVLDENKNLLPLFITVRNGGEYALENVQHGNERVLRARLADAQFFFDEDRKHPLNFYVDKLKTVVFQEGLGTIYDKTQRLVKLVEYLGAALKLDTATVATATKAASLAKADLVTAMVGEFTELQGIMGKEYALLDGEAPEVAEAIYQHYQPRFAGDEQPASLAGKLVSLADKMDNIVATFSRGLIPTGSQDPFALRRQALGISNTLIQGDMHLSLAAFAAKAMELLAIPADKQDALQVEVANFFRLRLKNILDDAQVRYDIVDACIENIDDLAACHDKAKMILPLLNEKAFQEGVQAFVRVSNIAQKAPSADFHAADLTLEAEQRLCTLYLENIDEYKADLTAYKYREALDKLLILTQPINYFFENIMVMDKDETLRNNRLGLLKTIDNSVKELMDFSKIVL